eukprot:38238-Eustigmatos_ZCMA.PRE.1
MVLCSIANQIGRDCEKSAKSIFPLQTVLVRKVKVLKKPKFDCESTARSHRHANNTVTYGLPPCQHRRSRCAEVPNMVSSTMTKLMEVYADSGEDMGTGVDRPEEAPLVPEVAGSGGRL